MWWQRFGVKLLQKNTFCYAVCLLASLAATLGLPLVNWLPCVIVALVTFAHGPRAAGVVLLWAITPMLALTVAIDAVDLRELLLIQLILVWFYAFCWRSAYGSLSKRKGGTLFSANLIRLVWWNILIGVIIVSVFHLVSGNTAAYWQHWLSSQEVMFTQIVQTDNSAVSVQQALSPLLPYFTGIAVALILCAALLAVVLGAIWKGALENNPQPRQELSALRFTPVSLLLPAGLILLTALVFLLGYNTYLTSLAAKWGFSWTTYLAWLRDTLPVYLAFYGLVGFALLQALFARDSSYRWILYVAYILLVILPYYMLGLLLVLVLIDSVFNFRERKRTVKRA